MSCWAVLGSQPGTESVEMDVCTGEPYVLCVNRIEITLLTLCVLPENINHQCCLKPEYQISLLTSWGHVKVKNWLQKVLRTFVFSMYMYRHTHTRTQYLVNIIKELQDNEAKFKVCTVYWYTVLGFIVAFSIVPDWLCLLRVHARIWPELAPMKACESRH